MNNLDISPSTQIIGKEEKAFIGRVGFIGFDVSSQTIIAVTAAQIVMDEMLYHKDSNVNIMAGYKSTYLWPDRGTPDECSVIEMLSVWRLKSGFSLQPKQISVNNANIRNVTGIESNYTQYLGDIVYLQNGSDKQKTAFVEAIETRFIMPHPRSGEMTLFTGALRIRSIDDEPTSLRGDAGCW